MRCVVGGVVLCLVVAACGGTGSTASTTDPSVSSTAVLVPAADELAAMLLIPEEVGEGWEYSDMDRDGEPDPVGVVTGETRELIPRMSFCPEADPAAQMLAEGLEWQAFTQIEFAGDITEIEGQRPVIGVQEFLLSGDPAGVKDSYELLADAVTDCAGVEWEIEDGTVIRSEGLAVASVGDASVGEHASLPVPGDRRWDIRSVTVVDGAVLMVVVEFEAGIGTDAATVVSAEDLDRIVTTAADKLAA